MATQARAGDDHEIDSAVEFHHLGGCVEGAEAQGVVFGNHGAAMLAGHQADTQLHQPSRFRTGVTGAVAEPQQRAFCRNQKLGEIVQGGVVRRRLRYSQHRNIVELDGPLDQGFLHIDGKLDADRPSGRRQRLTGGLGDDGKRLIGVIYAIGRLGDRRQHGELIRHIMDRAAPQADIGARRLPGEMQ